MKVRYAISWERPQRRDARPRSITGGACAPDLRGRRKRLLEDWLGRESRRRPVPSAES